MLIRALRPLFLALSCSIIAPASVFSQSVTTPPVISADGLQKDVALLRSVFEKLHPGLLRYQTAQQSSDSFHQLARDLNHDLSQREIYLRLSAFAATIRCGHTYPNFFNQSKSVKQSLFDQSDRLPFFFRWIDGTMVVTQDFTPKHSLPPGTRILTVNGIATSTVLLKLMPLARGDGANNFKRIDYLQVVGAESYEATDLLAPLVFPAWHGPFRLTVQKAGAGKSVSSRTAQLSVPAVSAAERAREGLLTHPDPTGTTPLFTLSFLPGGAAVLKMPTWEIYKTTWDWTTWLNNALDQIVDRKAPALIVDLRGNEGGNDVGDLILDRLRNAASTLSPSYTPLLRYRKVPEEFRPYLSTYDKRIMDWGPSAKELDAPWPTAPPVHYFRREEEPDQPSAADGKPKKPFTGKVLVLTDASISSATFNFCRAIQTAHLGTLIGEPTGGNKRGINGGSFFFLQLPNSGIEIDIPLVGTFPARDEPDEGLTPEIVVRVTARDIAHGIDAIFSRAKLIANGSDVNR